uniref:Uncharacterized protein LOC112833628 n=1 Tax=Callorhinus ursinus TaxID=34884 RepID=A0A3Q7QEN8_CALUR|nr:uncharacterized protein LOC112833628 [Callorhinus ursinus]
MWGCVPCQARARLGLRQSVQAGRAPHARDRLASPAFPPSLVPSLPPSFHSAVRPFVKCQDAVTLCSMLGGGGGPVGAASRRLPSMRIAAAARGKVSKGEGREQLWRAFRLPSPAQPPSSASVGAPIGAPIQGLAGFREYLGPWLCRRLSVVPPYLVRSHSLVSPRGALARVSSLVRGHVASTRRPGFTPGPSDPQVLCSFLYSHHLPFFIISGIVFLIQRPVSFTNLIRNHCGVSVVILWAFWGPGVPAPPAPAFPLLLYSHRLLTAHPIHLLRNPAGPQSFPGSHLGHLWSPGEGAQHRRGLSVWRWLG